MKRIIPLCLFLTVAWLYGRELPPLIVKVVDPGGKPIPEVIATDGHIVWRGNAQGNIALPATREYRAISLSRIGWKETRIQVADTGFTVIMQPAPIPLESVEVRADRTSAELADISGKRELSVPAGETPQSILQRVPSLFEPASSVVGKTTGVSFQGHRAKHTLVMIDGIPMNPNGESFDLGSIPVDLIDRIEVLPMGSGTGGSGEIGGVVNLITRRPDTNTLHPLQTKLTSSLGAFGRQDHYLRVDGTFPGISASLGWKDVRADNDFGFDYPQSTETYQTRKNADYHENGGDLVLDLPNLNLSSWFAYQRFHKGLPGPVYQQRIYDHCRLDGRRYQGKLDYRQPGRVLSWYGEIFGKYEYTTLDNRYSSNQYNAIYTVTELRYTQAVVGCDATLANFSNHCEAGTRIDTYSNAKVAMSNITDDTYLTLDRFLSLRSSRDIPLGALWSIET